MVWMVVRLVLGERPPSPPLVATGKMAGVYFPLGKGVWKLQGTWGDRAQGTATWPAFIYQDSRGRWCNGWGASTDNATAYYCAPGGQATPPTMGWVNGPEPTAMGSDKQRQESDSAPHMRVWTVRATMNQLLEQLRSPEDVNTQEYIIFNGTYRRQIMMKSDPLYCNGRWDSPKGRTRPTVPGTPPPPSSSPSLPTSGWWPLAPCSFWCGRPSGDMESSMRRWWTISGLRRKRERLR